MKRIRFAILILILALAIFSIAACGQKKTLLKPAGLRIDIDSYIATWYKVPDAKRYEVSITDKSGTSVAEESTRRLSYDASWLDEGSYRIKVRSVGASDSDVSDWSEECAFERAKETGIIYTAINNKSAYKVSGLRGVVPDGKLIIEDEHNGLPVVEIGIAAFSGSDKVTELVIGNNVKTIGDNAFLNCVALKSVEIPNSVESVGVSAFRGCVALESIKLPNSLTSVSKLCFGYCSGLRSIEFGSGLRSITSSAFAECKALERLSFPGSLVSVGDEAFYNCKSLQEITFAPGIRSIGNNAFQNCAALSNLNFSGELSGSLVLGTAAFASTGFTEVNLPDGVISLGSRAFAECAALENITIPDSVVSVGSDCILNTKTYNDQLNNSPYNKDDGKIRAIVYADNWVVACTQDLLLDEDFMVLTGNGYTSAQNVGVDDKSKIFEFREGVTGIATGVFNKVVRVVEKDDDGKDRTKIYTCNIQRLYIPSSMKYIGSAAFAYCNKLSVAVMIARDPSTTLDIGPQAFENCKLLSRVKFVNGLRSIGACAFMKCGGLDAPTGAASRDLIPESVESIGAQAFYGTKIWPETVSIADYKNLIDEEHTWEPGEREGLLNKLGVGENPIDLVYAGGWLVGYNYNCLLFENVTLGTGLKQDTYGIADYALYGCLFLESIDLTGVKYVGAHAFSRCENLTEVRGFAGSVIDGDYERRKIEPYTFFGCANLKTIVLSSNIVSIGDYAFAMSGLQDIDLEAMDLLTDIGSYAFFGCQLLSRIKFEAGCEITEIKPYTFAMCLSLQSVQLPAGVTHLDDYAFAYCTGLENVDLTVYKDLEVLGDFSFRGCEKLASVKLNDKLSEIGDGAFYQCAQLNKVEFGTGLKTIGDYAFAEDASLMTLTLPGELDRIGAFAFSDCFMLRNVYVTGAIKEIDKYAFYGADNVTVYIADGVNMSGWNALWNATERPVAKNCTFGEDGVFVSMKVTADSIENVYAYMGLATPIKEGYTFKGWYTDPDDPETVVDLKEAITRLKSGSIKDITLYAVWEKTVEPPEEETPPEGENPPEEQEPPEGETPPEAGE